MTVSAAPTVATWTSANETINVGATFTYAGAFTQGAGDLLNLSGGALTLSGATIFAGGATAGSQRLSCARRARRASPAR